MSKERRLGRGLAALLGEDNEPVHVPQDVASPRLHTPNEHGQTATDPHDSEQSELPPNREFQPDHGAASEASVAKDGDLLLLSVHEIDDNPFQPRREFSESEITSLAESLKEHDMLQPVLVRRVEDRWQLISGERRLRAAIQAGWSQIPARVRQADDRLVAELAIVENLQRKDLNAIEKALSFRRYLDQHQSTQEDLGKRLKIDRSTIANLLRLLELPERVQTELQGGSISAGHARALLPLGDEEIQIEFSQRIHREGISVRETERLVQERIELEDGDGLGAPSKKSGRRKKKPRDGHVASLEQQLRILLGTKVDIRQSSRGRGQIVIHFRSNDEFERLHGMIKNQDQNEHQSYAG
ncbi:MAG: ParB/RepB/Spo0J family partition protein [Planctomycetaceae bacterium]|nr:ParB/RepB/Spo0J family partition protein [Planctomycetaceae bacterium]